MIAASEQRTPGHIAVEMLAGAVVGLVLYRVTRPLRRDRYWKSWLENKARACAWGSLACGAAAGALSVLVALLTHTSEVTSPILDGVIVAVAGFAIVKLSVESYGTTSIAKVGLVTSLGAAWLEADLDSRCEAVIARWATDEAFDQVERAVKILYLQVVNSAGTKPHVEIDDLRRAVKDELHRLDSKDPGIAKEAQSDLRSRAMGLMIRGRAPRSEVEK